MLSIIVPVFNEEESLKKLHKEICQSCDRTEPAISFEVIFVDDGSTDTSWKVIDELAQDDHRVSGIRFRRNFGKAAALTAGMQAAEGDVMMMMDADLQDDPAEIPKFLAKLDEDEWDVVNGWKQKRLDPWHKVYPSKVFNGLAGLLSGLKLHDHNCGLKMFRCDVAREIRIYGELHRFIPILAHAKGFRVTELAVNHRERQFGYSKYGIRRFLRGFLDLLTVKFLTSFGQRPQHALGTIGLVFFGLGLLGLGYLMCLWFAVNLFGIAMMFGKVIGPIGNRPLLGYSIASLLLGAQGIAAGLLAELMVSFMGRKTDNYSIRAKTHLRNSEEEPAENHS